jgi:methylenetetrahydrofolate dehydrogenase (NADP+)/methenyltetrahydrofolate cyclohydrolase
MTKYLWGTNVAKDWRKELQAKASSFKKTPTLCVIEAGDDPAVKVYDKVKKAAAAEIGIGFKNYALQASDGQAELMALVERLNNDEDASAIMVELPLPARFDAEAAMNAIRPDKDADCCNAENLGRLWQGSSLAPATAFGIMKLLDCYQVPIAGKNAVIVGRSAIVGKPLAALLLARDATVTVAHSKTANLASLTRNADILVSDTGQPGLIKPEMVNKNAAVIDVGISKQSKGWVGDVSERVKPRWLTPVPGGVGPMTVAALMHNVLYLTERQHGC